VFAKAGALFCCRKRSGGTFSVSFKGGRILNVKEQRFACACAKGETLSQAAESAGYTLMYAERLARRPDIIAETARIRDRERTEEARRELREYLLDVMRGESGDESIKMADRVRAAEFFERYFEAEEEDEEEKKEVLEVIVDYGDMSQE